MSTTAGSHTPKVFMSYSSDGAVHQEWVKMLAAKLRSHGVDVTLDRWALSWRPAPRVHRNHRSRERARAHRLHAQVQGEIRFSQGGRGIRRRHHDGRGAERPERPEIHPSSQAGRVEGCRSILACREVLSGFPRRPLLGGELRSAFAQPIWYEGASSASRFQAESKERPDCPGAGHLHASSARRGTNQNQINRTRRYRARWRNDGTRGRALYRVPFQLSRWPYPVWAQNFVQTWNRPPSLSTMHRPGIARIEGDRSSWPPKMKAIPGSAAPGQQAAPVVASSSEPSS